MKAWHLLWPDRPAKPRYPRKLAHHWVITRPNQLWQTDITYGYMAGEDRFFYVPALLDVCDRSIVAYHRGLFCRAADAAQTLPRAVEARRAEWGPEPPVIRTDNGPPNVRFGYLKRVVKPWA
ncbi:MAG: DDE-type integrase/transposase/recombinase [Firmicutes bacterium]|nr:DDE-type integrase/transposase/recombinase [Bacillota bacterium]